jgi:hypothetical protein
MKWRVHVEWRVAILGVALMKKRLARRREAFDVLTVK